MLWLRWIVAGFSLPLSVWLIGLNGLVFWKGYIRREQTASWISLLGGGLGAIALAAIPIEAVHRWWWVPLLLDWGSVPGFVYTIFWHVTKAKRPSD
jgi:hypothetical protein